MKTLIRIQEGQDTKLGYGFLTAQILVKPWKDSDTVNVIGHISFQRTLSEEDIKWYAMKFHVDSDNVRDFQKMTSLLRFIKKCPGYDYNSQPEDIFKMIGAVEYVVFDHDFILKSKVGQNLYYVKTGDELGNLYTKIIAPDEKKAQKILDKMDIAKEVKLELKSKIVL